MTIGLIIRELRESRKWKRIHVARALHVSEVTVRAWELDRNEPRASMIIPLAKLFGVSPMLFLEATNRIQNL